MPKVKSYLGIDPGLSGGLALLSSTGALLEPMPQTERSLCAWLKYNVSAGRASAMIEWINPGIPYIGKSSMSKLYGNYMGLRYALAALQIPFVDVKPKEWQRGLGIMPRKKTETQTQWKTRLLREAENRFPELKVTKATADALLIALYCKQSRWR